MVLTATGWFVCLTDRQLAVHALSTKRTWDQIGLQVEGLQSAGQRSQLLGNNALRGAKRTDKQSV